MVLLRIRIVAVQCRRNFSILTSQADYHGARSISFVPSTFKRSALQPFAVCTIEKRMGTRRHPDKTSAFAATILSICTFAFQSSCWCAEILLATAGAGHGLSGEAAFGGLSATLLTAGQLIQDGVHTGHLSCVAPVELVTCTVAGQPVCGGSTGGQPVPPRQACRNRFAAAHGGTVQ